MKNDDRGCTQLIGGHNFDHRILRRSQKKMVFEKIAAVAATGLNPLNFMIFKIRGIPLNFVDNLKIRGIPLNFFHGNVIISKLGGGMSIAMIEIHINNISPKYYFIPRVYSDTTYVRRVDM